MLPDYSPCSRPPAILDRNRLHSDEERISLCAITRPATLRCTTKTNSLHRVIASPLAPWTTTPNGGVFKQNKAGGPLTCLRAHVDFPGKWPTWPRKWSKSPRPLPGLAPRGRIGRRDAVAHARLYTRAKGAHVRTVPYASTRGDWGGWMSVSRYLIND
ncbi:uncharacterized protein LOC112346625 [Selaginella moellendorffii]|uniref:uncharacterized protein LOC112346625 n=1 Tax=Selaginella moellendorffii TaxID=88036 RepID=UPI000D1CFF5D|nr:uncharacterized protein LOC112346625 [Selaginella moellendorffii]|eukprot:XP_024531794.1 uncharacterized protein LOC112346625 [Selaginella moellendorffii]